MYCVLSNPSFFRSTTGRAVSFFFLFWGCVGGILFFYTLFLRHTIQQQSLKTLTTALNRYIEQSYSPQKGRFSLQNSLPREIDFLRIVKDQQQLLITGTKRSLAFQGLVDLDPFSHGAWIDLLRPEQEGHWVVISQNLPSGGVVQAGVSDNVSGISIYRQTLNATYLLFVLLALPCLGLAFIVNRMLNKPLRFLESTVRGALKENFHRVQTHDPSCQELRSILHLLDEIFSQKRHLIDEMQSSLDNVAHDLRTPMTRLRAVAEYALQSNREDSKIYRDALSDCLEESERVLSMLNVMMNVAEAESGTLCLDLVELDIMETVEDVVGLYRYVAEEEKITVIFERSEQSVPVRVDRMRISQVWANILDNAIKYSLESGTVTIDVSVVEDQARVRFYDDGMGISPGEMDRIWERLYRGDRSRTKQGLGLGLNYVKAVVEAHEGRVLVKSKIREGACFEVFLPLARSTICGKMEVTE